MGISDQSKWDKTAIEKAYEDLLDQVSSILDLIKINGFTPLIKSVPLLARFVDLISLMEKEVLIQWKLREEHNLDSLFSRHRSWLNLELRATEGFFDIYNQLVSELWQLSKDKTPLSGQDCWQSSVIRLLTDSHLISSYTGASEPLSQSAILERVACLIETLVQISPYHLCLSFLNLIELGAGPRPEIVDFGTSEQEHQKIEDLSGIHRLFLDVTQEKREVAISASLTEFWKDASGGVFSLFPAFLVHRRGNEDFELRGITPAKWIQFDQLLGIDTNRDILLENTRRFIANQPAHHVLLWGGRGTGKSSSVKALLETFRLEGLRLVEIQQKDLDLVPEIARQLGQKKEKFLLFCDDLSFDQDDSHYKHLKTVMEGSLAGTPQNLLFIATANRKDLVFRGDLDERLPEQKQLIDEKRAIDDRFGLKLYYDVPVFKQLSEILYFYADASGFPYDPDELLKVFRQFAQRNNHDNPAGRTVQQFIQEWSLSQQRD